MTVDDDDVDDDGDNADGDDDDAADYTLSSRPQRLESRQEICASIILAELEMERLSSVILEEVGTRLANRLRLLSQRFSSLLKMLSKSSEAH